MSIGILGGGLSAVTLQRFLKTKSEILEKEDRPGGLCRTFFKDGFNYDIGGHILFSKDKQIMRLVRKFLGSNCNLCRREVKVLFKGRFIKYPFENGLSGLDKRDNYECLIGYLRNDYRLSKTFKDWIYKQFGRGIAEKYLIPYNEKIWKFPLNKMSCEWVERIPKPPVEDVVKSALGIETEGYTHQLYFNYPLQGGIEGLIKAFISDKSNIVCDFKINRIEKSGKRWLVSDGTRQKCYDKLVSTIPLKDAVRYIPGVPNKVLKAAAGLRHNAVKVVLIGVNNESLIDKSAVYIPDAKVLPHRLCYMKFYSPNNAPKGKSSLIAEISMSPKSRLYYVNDDSITNRVIDDLLRIRILNKKRNIVTTDIRTIDYGYVIYDNHYRENLSIVKRYFASLGIHLHGRFGEFEYINMDEVLKRSIRLASRL